MVFFCTQVIKSCKAKKSRSWKSQPCNSKLRNAGTFHAIIVCITCHLSSNRIILCADIALNILWKFLKWPFALLNREVNFCVSTTKFFPNKKEEGPGSGNRKVRRAQMFPQHLTHMLRELDLAHRACARDRQNSGEVSTLSAQRWTLLFGVYIEH
jgi:hypothetical protein